MKERQDMSATVLLGHEAAAALLTMALVFSAQAGWADDLTGSDRFLCAAVQATVCVETGECVVDLPWNVNVPEYIEVDLEAKRLSTTAASGENRTTRIEHLKRGDDTIVFHGFEMGRPSASAWRPRITWSSIEPGHRPIL
jgi:hypothetical protein